MIEKISLPMLKKIPRKERASNWKKETLNGLHWPETALLRQA